MQRRPIGARKIIVAMLTTQVVPLLLFPPESFARNSQEWWLRPIWNSSSEAAARSGPGI
jgi:hypothetical protein